MWFWCSDEDGPVDDSVGLPSPSPGPSPTESGCTPVSLKSPSAVTVTVSMIPKSSGDASGTVDSQSGHLLRAVVNLVLFGYSSLVTATVKLLFCVTVPGEVPSLRFLYLDATRQCSSSGWQVCAGSLL